MSIYGPDDAAAPLIGIAPGDPGVGIHGAPHETPLIYGTDHNGPADPATMTQIALVKDNPSIANDELAQLARMRATIQQDMKTMTTDQAAAAASAGNPALAGVARDMALAAVPAGETAQEHDKDVSQQQAKDNAQTQQALAGLLGLGAGAGLAAGVSPANQNGIMLANSNTSLLGGASLDTNSQSTVGTLQAKYHPRDDIGMAEDLGHGVSGPQLDYALAQGHVLNQSLPGQQRQREMGTGMAI